VRLLPDQDVRLRGFAAYQSRKMVRQSWRIFPYQSCAHITVNCSVLQR
jgi:hypothetical protein